MAVSPKLIRDTINMRATSDKMKNMQKLSVEEQETRRKKSQTAFALPQHFFFLAQSNARSFKEHFACPEILVWEKGVKEFGVALPTSWGSIREPGYFQNVKAMWLLWGLALVIVIGAPGRLLGLEGFILEYSPTRILDNLYCLMRRTWFPL